MGKIVYLTGSAENSLYDLLLLSHHSVRQRCASERRKAAAHAISGGAGLGDHNRTGGNLLPRSSPLSQDQHSSDQLPGCGVVNPNDRNFLCVIMFLRFLCKVLETRTYSV